MAVLPPEGYIPFSKLRIGQKKIRIIWSNLLMIFCLTGVVVFLAIKIHYLLALIFPISISFAITYSRQLLFWSNQQWISVGLSHPWSDEEDVDGECGVAIFLSEEKWVVVPLEGRLLKISSDELSRYSLILSNEEDEKIGYWDYSEVSDSIGNEIIELINMALALRDAQLRDADTDDPFEKSRERENKESLLLDREWGSIEPGQFDIQLGALARKFVSNNDQAYKDETE